MTKLTDKDELKNEKYSDSDTSRIGMPSGNNAIDPNVAAFHNYLLTGAIALVKTSGMYRSPEMLAQQQKEVQRELDRKDSDAKAEFLQFVIADALIRQQEIDNNIMQLTVNGKKLNISQKDLREIMEERVRDLKEERDAMIKNGASPAEIHAKSLLINRYGELGDSLKSGKADDDTLNDVHRLIEDDPDLANHLERRMGQNAESNLSKCTSLAAEYDNEEALLSLSGAFNRAQSPSNVDTPSIEKQPHVADKMNISLSTPSM